MSSIHNVLHLCDQYDLIVLQERWLFKRELSILNNLHVQFEAFGCSAIDDSNGIVRGRPYGGLGVLIRKSFRPIANFHTYEDSRFLGITIKSDTESLYFLNTYLPYQCNDNVMYMLSIWVKLYLLLMSPRRVILWYWVILMQRLTLYLRLSYWKCVELSI